MKKKITALLAVCAMLVPLFPSKALAAAQEANPDTSDWFPYEVARADEIEGTILDASDMIEKPSGKHGYLNRTEGEDMYFEDGTKARFWGVNITAGVYNMPYETAEECAKRIAQSGFNLARIFVDVSEAWGPKAIGGRVRSKDAQDKLFYLISQLKKNGIYVDMNLMGSAARSSDLAETYDIENLNSSLYGKDSYLSETLKNAQKQNLEDIMEQYNPYTGMALKDDPTIVMVEIKNECSIAGIGSLSDNKYVKDAQKRYNDWLREKYGNTENLRAAWYADSAHEPNHQPLDDDENLEDGTVKIFDGQTTLGRRRIHRQVDEFKFRLMLFDEYYDDVIPYLRDDVGVKCLITSVTGGSEAAMDLLTFYGNRDKDYSDFHMYTALSSANVYADGVTRDKPAKSILETGGYTLTPVGLISDISRMYVYGLPHTISEWNDVAPNKYRAETLLMMGAYTSLHGSNPIMFDWKDSANDDTVTTDTLNKETFGCANTPEYMAALPAISRAVLRGDIAEADSFFPNFRYQDDEIYSTSNQYLKRSENYSSYLGFIGKTGMIFEDAYSEDVCDDKVLQLAYDAYNGDKNFVSVTGQISMDYTNKMFRLNTPKTQAISGFTSGKTVELDDVKFELDNYYATAYLNSVDDKPLNESNKMLLTLAGDTRNTDQVMSDDESTIISKGKGPVLVEPVTGTVTIKSSKAVVITAISSKGQPIKTIRPRPVKGGYSFKLEASTKAMHYQITRSSASTKNEHISLGNTDKHDMFDDVTAENPKKKEIERIALEGFMSARSENNFMPSEPVTRREFFTALVYGTNMAGKIWTGSDAGYNYGDLTYDEDGFKGMSVAVVEGLITPRTIDGVAKCVEPDKPVTRGEAMTWISKFIRCEKYPTLRTKQPDASFNLNRYPDAYEAGNNAEHYRYTLGMGYMDAQNGRIAADAYVTRQDTADTIYRLVWK